MNPSAVFYTGTETRTIEDVFIDKGATTDILTVLLESCSRLKQLKLTYNLNIGVKDPDLWLEQFGGYGRASESCPCKECSVKRL